MSHIATPPDTGRGKSVRQSGGRADLGVSVPAQGEWVDCAWGAGTVLTLLNSQGWTREGEPGSRLDFKVWNGRGILVSSSVSQCQNPKLQTQALPKVTSHSAREKWHRGGPPVENHGPWEEHCDLSGSHWLQTGLGLEAQVPCLTIWKSHERAGASFWAAVDNGSLPPASEE